MPKNKINIDFGLRVQSLRKKLGISQEQLSYLCELNRTYMGAIERGEKSPSLNTIVKISNGLKISLKELFDY